MKRLSAVVLLLFFVFAKPVHHVILFFLSARFSLPVALPQKEHRSHLFEEFSVLEKLVFMYSPCACLAPPFLGKMLTLKTRSKAKSAEYTIPGFLDSPSWQPL